MDAKEMYGFLEELQGKMNIPELQELSEKMRVSELDAISNALRDSGLQDTLEKLKYSSLGDLKIGNVENKSTDAKPDESENILEARLTTIFEEVREGFVRQEASGRKQFWKGLWSGAAVGVAVNLISSYLWWLLGPK